LSKASHDTSTSLSTRSISPSAIITCAPHQSLKQRVTAQIQAFDELSQQAAHPAQRKVRAAPHRLPVRAHRQRRQDAAVAGAKVGDNVPPLRAVHRQSVHQHDRRAGTNVLVSIVPSCN
jgi:hypothetical protein